MRCDVANLPPHQQCRAGWSASLTVTWLCSCGLVSLQWLQWPNIPHSIAALFAERWPKLLVDQSTPPTDVACLQTAIDRSCTPATNIVGQWHSAQASNHTPSARQRSAIRHWCHDTKPDAGSQGDAAIDAPMAALVSKDGWRGIAPSEEEEFMKLHIADRFLRACQAVERAPLLQNALAILQHVISIA